MDEFLSLSRLVHFAAAMVLFGASLFSLYAYAGLSKGARVRAAFERWLGNTLLLAAVAAFLSALAWWDALAVLMGEGRPDALNVETLEAVLFDTAFGQIWIWRLAISALLIFVLLLARRGDWTLSEPGSAVSFRSAVCSARLHSSEASNGEPMPRKRCRIFPASVISPRVSFSFPEASLAG